MSVIENLGTMRSVDRLAFKAEWYQIESSMLRNFILFFYPTDCTISLYDFDKKRLFLKRTKVINVSKEDIYIGNSIKIFSRLFKIVDYANDFTRVQIRVKMQNTVAVIKPEAINHMGPIFEIIVDAGFKIVNLRMMKMPQYLVEQLYRDRKGLMGFSALVSHVSSKPVIALELINDLGVQRFKELSGLSPDPEVCRNEEPNTIRALFGEDTLRNAIHRAESIESADYEREIIFGSGALEGNYETDTATLKNSTCCVIKPHAIKEGNFGKIITSILKEGYSITAMRMFYLDQINADEFLEIYRGVFPEYPDMVGELIEGGCVALEVVGPTKEETPTDFRHFVGPMDPDVARQLRPSTLRAKFGQTKVKNAIHVTDLPEDALLEVEYFFKILA